jgi:hypothetical protein
MEGEFAMKDTTKASYTSQSGSGLGLAGRQLTL